MEDNEVKKIIKNNNDIAASYAKVSSAVDDVIKKYKNSSSEALENQDLWNEVIKDAEKLYKDYSGDIQKGLPVDIQEGLGKLTKSWNRIKTTEDVTNQIIKITRSFDKGYSIRTAVDGIEFNSLESWNEFYNSIKAARVTELKNLQGNDIQKKIAEYGRFDELMALELKRYTDLNKSKERYHKAARVRYTDLSFWTELVTGKGKSPYQLQLDHKKEVSDINTNHQKQIAEILNAPLNYKKTSISTGFVNNSKINKMKAEKDISASLENIKEDKIKSNFDIQQKLTNMMDEGYQKKYRQLHLEYEKEVQTIEELTKAKFREQKDFAKNLYIKKNGTEEGFDMDKANMSLLPKELQTPYIEGQQRQSIDLAKQTELKGIIKLDKEQEKLFKDEEIRLSSSLRKQLYQIEQNYQQKIELVKGNEGLIALYKENKEKDIAQATLKDSLQRTNDSEKLALEDLKGLQSLQMTELYEKQKFEITKKYLQEKLDINKSLAVAGDEAAAKEVKVLEQSIKNLDFQEPKKSLKGFADEAVFNQTVYLFERLGSTSDEAKEKTISLFSSIVKNASNVATVVGELQSVFGGLDEGLDMAMEAVGNIAQGFVKGGPVGGIMAIVGEGINMFKKAGEAEKRHQEALKAIMDGRNAAQHDYNLLLMEQNLLMKEAESIFGINKIEKAVGMINVYRDAIQKYNETIKGDGKIKPKGMFNMVYNMLDKSSLNSDIAALRNAEIITGHKKTGLFGWGKGKDIYSNILSVYPDLIEGENKLNLERAKSILNNEKMDDTTRTLLKNLVELQEKAEEAEEQLRSYLKETFGSLGDALTDSIINAFATGEDAAAKFKENVTEVLNSLAKQMVFQLFLSKMFNQLQEDIENIYKKHADKEIDEKELSTQVTNLLGGFFEGLDDNVEKANVFLEQFWSNAEKNGFDRPEGQAQASTSIGLASITQDSANRLNGSFDNMLRYTSAISDTTSQSLLVQQAMNSSLDTIAVNTSYLININATLEDIKIRGIKTKI